MAHTVVHLTLVVTVLLALTSYTTCIYPDVQAFHIYSGEHLDDTILPADGSPKSFVHAVLVIYTKECEHLLRDYDVIPDHLPMSKYALLLLHDYSTSVANTWYGFSGDDLRGRYNCTGCFEAVFLPRGTTRSSLSADTVRRWDPETGITFKAWVWEQILAQVTIKNHFGAAVTIKTEASGITSGPRDYPAATLLPEESATINVYESTVIHIYVKVTDDVTGRPMDKLISYWIVNGSVTINVIPSDLDKVMDDVMAQIQSDTRFEDYEALESAWCTMQRHLLNLKQPLVVPQFTEKGYKKVKMPEDWYAILRGFYDEHKGKERVDERWAFGDSVINQNKVQCSMVWLSDEVKETVAEGLRLMMEDWCGLELEMTAFYGIREYYGGNVLHNHVDRLDTHVISAIIQIDKNLDGEEDWLLEVIEYDGKRNRVALEPGDMLLYESARLIHGRPKVFRGKLYANVFLHFRPKYGWKNYYHHDADKFMLHYPDEPAEKLMPLRSDLTEKHGGKGNVSPDSSTSSSSMQRDIDVEAAKARDEL